MPMNQSQLDPNTRRSFNWLAVAVILVATVAVVVAVVLR
jgi:hypothetical protein